MRTLTTLVAAIIAAIGLSQFGQAQTKDSPEPAEQTIEKVAIKAMPIAIEDGRNSAYLDAQSPPITWHNGDYHLVQFGTVTLKLDDENHLTAGLKGGMLTFDDVKCTIHLAVFDVQGHMLGTAQHIVDVPRVWSRIPVLMFEDWQLDFGTCDCYQNVAYIAGSATHGKALTPDQWQD